MPEIKRPVLFCGENPCVTLYAPASDQVIAVVSYWHCTYSSHGSGHALVFWHNQPLDGPGPALGSAVFTDNPPLAEMLVDTLTQYFPEFRDIPVGSLPHLPAQCQQHSDGLRCYTVTCSAPQRSVRVEWADMLDHKHLSWPQFPAGPRTYDLTTVICPCRHATITVNGQLILGEVQTAEVEGRPTSSAFLAFAETWIGPNAADRGSQRT
jgi:hypothetical protein